MSEMPAMSDTTTNTLPAPANDDPWSAPVPPPEPLPLPPTPGGQRCRQHCQQQRRTDWLSDTAATDAAPTDWWSQLLHDGLPIQSAINQGLDWVVTHFRPFFQAVRTPIDATLTGVENTLQAMPWPVLTVLLALIAWQFASRALAIGTAISLAMIALLGISPEAMVTLSLVLDLVGVLHCDWPAAGHFAGQQRPAQSLLRPLLDAMQTTPAFLYLVPVVMLFWHWQRAGGGLCTIRVCPAPAGAPDQPGHSPVRPT